MTGELKAAGTPDDRRPMAADAGRQAGQGPTTGAGATQPAAGSAREMLIRELGAILAGWGVTERDDDLLAPLASSVAGLLAAGPEERA